MFIYYKIITEIPWTCMATYTSAERGCTIDMSFNKLKGSKFARKIINYITYPVSLCQDILYYIIRYKFVKIKNVSQNTFQNTVSLSK